MRAAAFLVLICFGTAHGAVAAEVAFSGAKSFTEEQLRVPLAEHLAEIKERGLTPARADDAAFFLAGFYRREGFPKAEVEYTIRNGRLILRVVEGERATVRSLHFEGNRAFDAEQLSEFLLGVQPGALTTQSVYYHASDIAAGIDRLRGLYASQGWLDALIEEASPPLSNDGKHADLRIRIVENMRYTFGSVLWRGADALSEAERVESLGLKPEGAFTPFAVDAMQRSVQSWLRGQGYFQAKVRAEWNRQSTKGGRVTVTMIVEAGSKFRISRVTLRDLERVKPVFMQKRFESLVDADYSPSRVDEKYRELLRTGLFRSLRMVPVAEGRDKLRLDVQVEEAPQKEFGLDLGFGSYEGFTAGIRLGDRNFLRTGRPASMRLEYSQRGFRGELQHLDPWLLDSEFSLKSRIFSEVREEQGYSKIAQGVRFDLTRAITPRWEVAAFAEAAYTTITTETLDLGLLGPTDYFLTSIGLSQKIDRRDDPLNPRRGDMIAASLDLNALNGQLAFARATVRYSHYRAFGSTLLAFGLRAGWILPFQGDEWDVPIDLRYFNGGGSTVRSFADRDLGPKDSSGDPLGGTFYSVANLEWNFPIAGALGGALFFDAGNLTLDGAGIEDLRYAVGLGLRYQLPIGPMRLDYGFNPDAHEDEDVGAIHFSFGFAF